MASSAARFHPQPYRQLAHVLRENGDDTGAQRVLIAADDLRYSHFGLVGRIWGRFLRETIGYGHPPMLTIIWSLAVVILRWLVVWMAGRAGVMRRTWPENAPRESEKEYEPVRPLAYSLDVFLPFVNLHQEHYWWPNTAASGSFRVFGVPINPGRLADPVLPVGADNRGPDSQRDFRRGRDRVDQE